MPRLLISEQGKNLTPNIRCSAPPSTLHMHLCNTIYSIELVSYIYNISSLKLTINMLLLGFRFRHDGNFAHTPTGVTWATWRAPSHWPPTLFCHSKDTDKHICSCSSVLTKHVMHLRLHLTLWAHSHMFPPTLGASDRKHRRRVQGMWPYSKIRF